MAHDMRESMGLEINLFVVLYLIDSYRGSVKTTSFIKKLSPTPKVEEDQHHLAAVPPCSSQCSSKSV